MSERRTRYSAEFLYPGSFMPESITRPVGLPTWEAVLAAQPTETEGTYFVRDGWYAVRVSAIVEKRFTAADLQQAWIPQERPTEVGSWIVGERIHVDDEQIAGSEFDILRSNIRSNTADGYAVRTRCGNWQMARDYGQVVAPEAVSA